MKTPEINIALVGQPNCGKSTLFNAVAGFQVDTGNFSGTTVKYYETRVRFHGHLINLIDLPGTYSLSSHDYVEKITCDFLLKNRIDVVINVMDSALMSRSLELTLELAEMKLPMVAALNMADEAKRKGIEFDLKRFHELTGIRAFPVVAVGGLGIQELFHAAIEIACSRALPLWPRYDRDLEECIAGLMKQYPETLRKKLPLDERFVVIRLLEKDEETARQVAETDPDFFKRANEARRELAELHQWPESGVFASHRHAIVLDYYEQIATHHPHQGPSFRENLDRIIFNPVGGMLLVLGFFFVLFATSFWLGDRLSVLMEPLLNWVGGWIKGSSVVLSGGLLGALLMGFYDGIVSGAGIVLPYLVPLLFFMAFFEDTGLLPRIAFLTDGILHRFGLHGKSIVPLLLGTGCNVPAILSTRNIENPVERIRTMLLVPFVSCSARSVVVLAIAGKYLGTFWVLMVYFVNIAVTLTLSRVLTRFSSSPVSGLIMEVPTLRGPVLSILLRKIWYRIYEFLVYAWPVLIISNIVLGVFTWAGFGQKINHILSPLTEGLLRLPEATGIPMFLGVFRKELTLLVLNTELGTKDLATVLTHSQMLVLVLYTLFSTPCIATLSTLYREGGKKTLFLSIVLNLCVSFLIAGVIAQLLRFIPLG